MNHPDFDPQEGINLHERDHRIEFLMRWRDQEQAKHGSNQPPFQRLKEIALALRHLEQRLESISMIAAARDAAARPARDI
jgi:hypothetical protein